MAISRSFKFVIGFAALFIVACLWAAYFFYNLSPVSGGEGVVAAPTSTVPLIIERGTGFRTVAKELATAGLIRSETDFKFYAILSGSAHQFKPGLYSFSAASSSIQIIHALVKGPDKEITVLIPEGQTLTQIDEILSKFGVIKKGSLVALSPVDFVAKYPFLKNAHSFEGFFFPDTYRFYFGSLAPDVAATMLDNFVAKVTPLVSDEGTANFDQIPVLRRGIFDMHQIATVASIIEDEVPGSADRKVVSDILYRRLKMGMALQIDATVAYAKAMRDERYDTYKNAGLPPGPIDSAGLDAIDAALNPKASPYLYYLSDPKTKKTIFSKTFDEHKANVIKYLP